MSHAESEKQVEFDVFVSHNSEDKQAVAKLAVKLKERGLNPWFDQWYFNGGEQWLPAIERALHNSRSCVVVVGVNGFGKVHEEEMWRALEIAMDRKHAGRDYPVIPVLLRVGTRGNPTKLPSFLAARTWVEFSRSLNDEAALDRLVRAIRGQESSSAPVQLKAGESPYRGLKCFDVDDARLFFGREVLTDWVLSRLHGTASTEGPTRFLALLGASGSGKSSLVRAGVLAQLRDGALPGSEKWAQIITRPGSEPLASLAEEMAKVEGKDKGANYISDLMPLIEQGLRKSKDKLDRWGKALAPGNDPNWRLVVFVDQFEELFTFARKTTESPEFQGSAHLTDDRLTFVQNLLRAATSENGRIIVVLTMRSDFCGQCVIHEDLRLAVSRNLELVGPMSSDELRSAIETPAHLVGFGVETGLVELLVREIGDQPGALPLLQDALAELWNKTRETNGSRLTTDTYRALGGWEGTLSRRADAMLERLKAKGQESHCRQLFLDLINLGEGTPDTKRLVRWSELKPNGAAEAESLRALINSLAEPEIRLVTTNGDQATEDWTVEIIHEALIRAWGTLRGWLDEGRKELRLKRQLIDGAQRWYSSGDRTEKRSPQRLYVGTDLEDARQWAADSRGQLPDRVRECLEASEHAEQLRQEAEFRNRAANLVEALRTAATTAVPELLPKLKEVRSWADPFLQQQFDFSAEQSDAKLHAALGLLPQAVAVEYLQRQLLLTSAPQFAVIRDQLQPHADAISQSLWTAVGSPPTNSRAAFQAACALATYATDDQRWSQLAPAVAQELVRQNPMVVNHWVETLRPVRHRLLAPLAALYEDKTLRETERNLAVSIVTDYGADDAELLARLLLFADPPGFEQLLEPARRHQTVIQELLKSELEAAPPEVGASPDDYEAACEAQARRQSRAALALARLGNPEHIWRRLAFHPQPGQPRTQDPSLRTELIHDLPAFGCDLELVSQRLEQETDPSVVRALILTLGEFSIDVCSASARDQLIERLKLQARLRSDPDAGVCGAIEWLLRRWHKWPESGWPPELRVRKAPAIVAESVTTPRNWYINSLGQRMVVLPAGECLMGSPATERGRNAVNEPLHRRRIERPFALAATLITRDDYLEFVREKTMRDPNQGNPYVQTGDSPQTGITWYEAARYCNWLSEREQIASNQWCYLPNSSGEFAAGMKVADNLLDKTGYRLPTEAEWEYACRAGSACSRYFGMTTARLGEYSWFQNNSSERTWPVGIKKPNDAGLFDLLGNAWEWCQERALLYPTDGESTATLLDASAIIDGSGSRVLRGGTFFIRSSTVRAACRYTNQPGTQSVNVGFRPARTYR